MMEGTDVARELGQIPLRASAEGCFGAPTTAGDRTVIPVAEVGFGMGIGWGGGRSKEDDSMGGGGGGGGGGHARGVAAIEVGPDGVSIHPIEDRTAITLARIAFVGATIALVARTLLKLVRG
jgi:uncharacterized spore protein YtfJ